MSRYRADTVASVVRAASAEAIADGARAVEAEHLLLALSARDNSPAQLLLASAGLGHEEIQQLLINERRHSVETAGTVPRALQLAGVDRAALTAAAVQLSNSGDGGLAA